MQFGAVLLEIAAYLIRANMFFIESAVERNDIYAERKQIEREDDYNSDLPVNYKLETSISLGDH